MNINIDDLTPQDFEIARKAVEDVLVANSHISICEKDGRPSLIIRMSIEDAIRTGLRAIINHREGKE